MKILLLTDIPPCKEFTAGLTLDQLCRFLPPDSICCFAMVNPVLDAKLSPDLGWIPIAYTKKRSEAAVRPAARHFVGAALRLRTVVAGSRIRSLLLPPLLVLVTIVRVVGRYTRVQRALKIFARPFEVASSVIAWSFERLRRRFVVPRLADQAVEFGRAQNVDLVWAVLQGQTITQIAPDVAKRLNAPLITQVWDPLQWWLDANQIDRFSRRAALADFDRALRQSRACLAASWEMANEYKARYGTFSVPLTACLPDQISKQPDLCRFPGPEIELGMIGQFYAANEWLQLVRALTMSGWQVRGRQVRITVLGAHLPPGDAPVDRVRFLGWRGQKDVVEIVSALDLLYCPYPFDMQMDEVARLSFPSKLVAYFAAGRPILFHGPADSSPAKYLVQHDAACMVNDVRATAIYNAMCKLVDTPALYRRLGENAQKAFRADFTLETMRRNFASVLGIPLATPDIEATTFRPHFEPIQMPDVQNLRRANRRIFRSAGTEANRKPPVRAYVGASRLYERLLMAAPSRDENVQRHPETWMNFDRLGVAALYKKTFAYDGDYINDRHRYYGECKTGFAGNPHCIDIGSVGFLQRPDALKIYELAYFCNGDILDLGTHHGLSTSIMLGALQDSGRQGVVETVDISATAMSATKSNIGRIDGSERVHHYTEDALLFMQRAIKQQRKFGFIFMDHHHGYNEICSAAELAVKLLSDGGFILVHNYTDRGNYDPGHVYGIYQAVNDVILPNEHFVFCGNFGCCGLFRKVMRSSPSSAS